MTTHPQNNPPPSSPSSNQPPSHPHHQDHDLVMAWPSLPSSKHDVEKFSRLSTAQTVEKCLKLRQADWRKAQTGCSSFKGKRRLPPLPLLCEWWTIIIIIIISTSTIVLSIIIIIILMGHYHHHHCFDKTYCWSLNVLHLQNVHISPLSTLWVLECVCHFRRLQLPSLSESSTPYVPTAALFFCIAEHWTLFSDLCCEYTNQFA